MLFSFLFLLANCVSLNPATQGIDTYLACPYQTVWERALTVLGDYPLASLNQQAGRIETDWREQPATGRPYGLFGREGLENKERSQLTVTITPVDDGEVRLQIAERRQHWGFRGGAHIYGWEPIPPSQEHLQQILERFKHTLEKQGCRNLL